MLSILNKYTGEGVKVAVVDDGICPQHEEVGNISGGIEIELDCNEQIIYKSNYFNDSLASHGTICAAIIKRKAPKVEIYSVKIFGSEMRCDVRILSAAIHWAIDNKMNIVNLSLGTIGTDHLTPLWEVCQLACNRRVVIVSAMNARGFISYPAAFPQVISVGSNERYNEYDYTYHPDVRTKFVAAGGEYLFPIIQQN